MDIIHQIIEQLANYINQIGYIGIFIGMFLESTLVPIPSEIIMIPAGLAAFNGSMSLLMVIFFGVTGNVLGAGFSYVVAQKVGRPIIVKIGKYFFVKESTIIKIEDYFKKHGPISVFIGRLLVGFRHFISIPAGLAKMNLKKFYFYTTAGSLIWTSILTIVGYLVGKNEDLIAKYLGNITIVIILSIIVIILAYLFIKKKN